METLLHLPGHIRIFVTQQRRDFWNRYAVRQEQACKRMSESVRCQSFDLSRADSPVQCNACRFSVIRQTIFRAKTKSRSLFGHLSFQIFNSRVSSGGRATVRRLLLVLGGWSVRHELRDDIATNPCLFLLDKRKIPAVETAGKNFLDFNRTYLHPVSNVERLNNPMEEIIIEPGRGFKNYWRDIWRFRELFYFLAWRDILVRYKQTVIGSPGRRSGRF